MTYLTSAAVVKAIGAKSTYAECSDAAGAKFNTAGDGKFPIVHNKDILTISRCTILPLHTLRGCPVWNHSPHMGR